MTDNAETKQNISALVQQHQFEYEDQDDDEVGADTDSLKSAEVSSAKSASEAIEHVMVRIALGAGIPNSLCERLDAKEPVCVSITVPSAAWCAPVKQGVRLRWPQAEFVERDGTSRSDHIPTRGNSDVSAALRGGSPVIGISHLPGRFLPSALLTAADAHVVLTPPTGDQILEALKACEFEEVPEEVSDTVSAGLDYDEILTAFRKGASANQIVENLAKASTAKTRVNADDNTPPLEALAGYGEAKEFGLALAQGLVKWRRGDLPWSALSTAAVFYGPPGTGKTLCVKALAKTLNVPIVVTSVGDWFASSPGHLDSVIKAMQSAWDQARALKPAILFIDELDGLPDRRTLSDRGRDWWIPVINYALTLFDGAATSREGLILLGATNHAERLDPALVRPGRFDRLIEIPAPSPEGLAGILRHHLGKELPGADLLAIGRLRPGATGATAAQWVRDSKLKANAEKRDLRFEDLLDQVVPPETRPPDILMRIARHEAAHAVIGLALGVQKLESVSLATPGAEGVTRFSDLAHRLPTRAHFESLILTGLAGRAIDEADAQPDAGSGGGRGSDLARATELLAMLHVSCGLGDTLIAICEPNEAVSQLRVDKALRATVEGELQRLYSRAKGLVARHESAIDIVAKALLARRFLAGSEVRTLVGINMETCGEGDDDRRTQK